MDKILVSSNLNPDLDGYACSVGYAEYLNKTGRLAEPIVINQYDNEIKYVLNLAKIKPLEIFDRTKKINNKLIIVDTSNLDSLQVNIDPKDLIEIIDHRKVNDSHLYPWAKVQIEMVGACATLIVEKFIKSNVTPSSGTAYLLYGAVISNTINFKNKITTKRDIKAAKHLKNLINIPKDFAGKMFRARTDIEGDRLKDYIKHDYVRYEVLGKSLTGFQMEIVGAEQLIKTRLNEIYKIIDSISEVKKLDYCYMNIIDTLEAYNYILPLNNATKELFEKILGLEFKDGITKTDHIIMRKEIMAKIKDYLENK